MEEKEREDYYDDDDDIVHITAVQFFGMPYEAFLGKDTDNKKKKEEEKEKRKVENDERGKNSGGGAKRGNKMRGGIDKSASKGDNEDDTYLCNGHDFYVGGEGWSIVENDERDKKDNKESNDEEGEEEEGGESCR